MKTIFEMAREAGLPEAWISETGVLKWSNLERFAAFVRADERDACADLANQLCCKRLPSEMPDFDELLFLYNQIYLGVAIEDAIRARGDK